MSHENETGRVDVSSASRPENRPRYPKIVLATRNPGKVEELQALLAETGIPLLTLRNFPDCPLVDEDQPTLAGNASKKARIVFLHTGIPTLADDTGLEVEYLNGRPGVHSARYAGPDADDAENRNKLLKDLGDTTRRKARFRTVVAFHEPGGIHQFEGICEGNIGIRESGANGFGYDALFTPSGYSRTFAELPSDVKNVVSHRGQALRKFLEFLTMNTSIPS